MFGCFSGNYGHDEILRNYLKLPRWLKLNVVIQHGWYRALHERDLYKPGIYLVWSERLAEDVRNACAKKVFVLGAPFVLYRRKQGIERKVDAKGTVAFPQHSSPRFECKFDVDAYCNALSSLPEVYKPITICLHHRDVDAWGAIFEEKGFTVTTAGEGRQADQGFVKKFYEILSSHKYATSNDVGSYLFYSVEMGVPFFIMGDEVSFHNKKTGSSHTVCNGEEVVNKVDLLFRSVGSQSISDEQREFVVSELGVNVGVSKGYLLSYLVFRFFFFELPMSLPRFLVYGFKRLFASFF